MNALKNKNKESLEKIAQEKEEQQMKKKITYEDKIRTIKDYLKDAMMVAGPKEKEKQFKEK